MGYFAAKGLRNSDPDAAGGNQAGFSLVEVVMAVALSGILAGSLAGMYLAGNQAHTQARQSSVTLELAKGKLEEILAGIVVNDWQTGGWSGSFSEYPGYLYYVRGEDFAVFPDSLRTVSVTVYGPDHGGRRVELTTLIPKDP